MERINFNHLFYFYITAKEGSIKAAAEVLNVTQPTISDQIKLLEEYFGSPLFVRRARSLQLNKQGSIALEYAEKCFQLGQELSNTLRHGSELPKKSLDVGVVHSLSHFLIYEPLLKVFKKNDTSLNVKEGDQHYLLADLQEGLLDIVFTDRHESLASGLTAFKVGTNKTYAVASKQLASQVKVFPKGLSNIPFFNYTPGSLMRYEIDLFFRRFAIAPKIVGEGDDIDLLQMVTENSIAFTIVPEMAAKRFKQDKSIKVLGELKELQTSFWGIIRSSDQSIAREILEVSHEQDQRI